MCLISYKLLLLHRCVELKRECAESSLFNGIYNSAKIFGF